MLYKVFLMECQKLRHSKLLLVTLILPILATVMGSFNFSQNLDILSNSWYDLWTQVLLFYAYFFYPCLLGLYCGYVCKLEHTPNNWNAIFSVPISDTAIFIGKFSIIASLSLITQLFIGLLYLLFGFLMGVEGSLPSQLYLWLILGWVASLAVSSLLLCVALIIRSFAIPISVALAGGIGGLLLLAMGYGLYFPFSLICLGMNTLSPDIPLHTTLSLQTLVNSLFFTLIFTLIGIHTLKKFKY